MIRTLLIANRGEIACRIAATARRMGFVTVAVHSDADSGAAHVAAADRAVRIGPAPVAESYLNASAILDAARTTGADAIHPGYGFLSENPDFADAVEGAGLVWVGPPASAIRAIGLKDAAKRLMEKAGVPVVPGYHGEGQDPARLAAEADRIGYPVLIKARAGGGGKGMRRVERAADFAEALASARREAEAAFGDPACLIEKYIASPRHIEVQVLADAHGEVLHLFERDCSLQRRHQKVIEEAPAPGMAEKVRAAMTKAATDAARAIGYRGAGTVEFIAGAAEGLRPDGFWFMEMNTRLQVEHPVTEAITGLDLVEWQLRVASGEPLPFAQDALTITGHAVEARLYAEDPTRDFLPQTGRLHRLSFPEATAFAPGATRIDSGIREGDEVTPHYDPMLAKVIVHAATRTAALARLAESLDATRIAGVTTNAGFLAALARHPDVVGGRIDTGLIARDLAGLAPHDTPPHSAFAAAAVAALGLGEDAAGAGPWDKLRGFRLWGEAESVVPLVLHDAAVDCRVTVLPGGLCRVTRDGAGPVMVARGAPGKLRVTAGAASETFEYVLWDGRVTVFVGSRAWDFARPDPLAAAPSAGEASDTIRAPMPGFVRSVRVAPGEDVAEGDLLAVLEAMKMEHALYATHAALVAEVLVAEGAQVAQGDVLIRFAPPDG